MKLIYNGETTEYNIEFSRISANVCRIIGDLPAKEKGFKLLRDKYHTLIADYSEFNTVYRTIEGGVEFSNDGSRYEEPTKDNVIVINWNDEDDADGIRPEKVTVSVKHGDVVEDIDITKDMGWKKTITDKESVEYLIKARDVQGYTMNESELYVTYYHEVHHMMQPTLEKRVSDVEMAISDILDMILG